MAYCQCLHWVNLHLQLARWHSQMAFFSLCYSTYCTDMCRLLPHQWGFKGPIQTGPSSNLSWVSMRKSRKSQFYLNVTQMLGVIKCWNNCGHYVCEKTSCSIPKGHSKMGRERKLQWCNCTIHIMDNNQLNIRKISQRLVLLPILIGHSNME